MDRQILIDQLGVIGEALYTEAEKLDAQWESKRNRGDIDSDPDSVRWQNTQSALEHVRQAVDRLQNLEDLQRLSYCE